MQDLDPASIKAAQEKRKAEQAEIRAHAYGSPQSHKVQV
jgi:hypothetical protein